MTENLSSPAYQLYRLLWYAADWLYPPVCGGCNKAGERWCLDCQQSAPILGAFVCRVCGEPQARGNVCADCKKKPPAYTALRSWAHFDGQIRHALHRIKYRQDIGLSEALAKHLIELLRRENWEVDAIVPVPLSSQRIRQRGYNQASLLAFPLAIANRIQYKPGALKRVRETRTQVGLNEKARVQNVRDAFHASSHQVEGQNILLIDDVATTGATINSCASALLTAGAQSVYALTLARAVLHFDDPNPNPLAN